MFEYLTLCVVGYFVTSCHSAAAPFISPCKVSDKACILQSAKAAVPYIAAGIPELGVPPSDPLVLEDYKGNIEGLDLQFKNLKVAGTSKCSFSKLDVAADKSKLDIDLECPIVATGQYKVGGKLQVVPIEGEGDIEVKTDNVKISITAHIDIVDGSDGKKHWKIVKHEFTYEPKEQIYYKLDNLFNGNAEKAKPILDILNYSWKEVIFTIGKPIINELVAGAVGTINVFCNAVPADELTLD